MPLVSKAQRRWAFAHAKESGRTGKVAREFIAATPKGAKLPERAPKK